MTSVLSNFAGNAALTYLLNAPGSTYYLALHTSDPTVTALLATEVAGGGYVRQVIAFPDGASKTVVSTNAQIFPGMPAVTVTHLAVWDAISGGHMIFTEELATPVAVTLSGQFLVAAGDVAVSL